MPTTHVANPAAEAAEAAARALLADLVAMILPLFLLGSGKMHLELSTLGLKL